MKYKISAPHPSDHFLQIEMIVEGIEKDEVIFQLPSWRPGRYEIGNFSKNVRGWKAVNAKGETLPFRKITKDCWKVNTEAASEVHVHYSYYAAKADAGSCWLDEDLFYINPVHCCMYVPEKIQEEYTIELLLPENYSIATSLKKLEGVNDRGLHVPTYSGRTNEHSPAFSPASHPSPLVTSLLFAGDYHELVDSPVMASAFLQHHTYEVEKHFFHVWMHGECSPDWSRLINDFRRFSTEQIRMMREFPVVEFHFLILALPTKFHHGVEHLRSTMLAFGPALELMKEEFYSDFIGLASHELFHVWNVKTIRPAEMLPYDYTKENYSRLGFVYEGATTYYGDLFLARCGVYTSEQFFKEINVRLQKHFDNCPTQNGFNLSVADASFDTWLDGYSQGVPFRKTSIYDEGCIIALMLDLMIRRKTNNEKSLDDVLRSLYCDFGKMNHGYTDSDYISIIENLTNEGAADFFIDYIYGTEDYEPVLIDLLNHFGCELDKSISPLACEHHFGFKISERVDKPCIITSVFPFSPAYQAGLSIEDEIISVNEIKVENNLNDLLNHFIHQKVFLKVVTPMKKLKTISLESSEEKYFPKYALVKKEQASTSQQKSFSEWMKSAVRHTYSYMN